MLLLVRTAGAMYSIISDCDEGEILTQRLEKDMLKDSGISVQLLRAATLLPVQLGVSDVGALTSIRDPELGVRPTALATGPLGSEAPPPGKGVL